MLKYACNIIFLFFGLILNADNTLERPIVVVTLSYNNKPYVERNIDSICNQIYSNFRVVYLDDCSNDDTYKIAVKRIREWKKRKQFHLIRNKARVGALENFYNIIHNCRDDEIIVCLDGDDWFVDNKVLRKINNAYSSNDIWLTHGSMVEYPKGDLGWSIPIPSDIVGKNAFRSYRCPSHTKTFYAWLFKQIKLEDLLYEGHFFKMTSDQAMMFPMLEMAAERHCFIQDVTYVYNTLNPINDNKVNAELQRNLEAYIRSKTPYERLKDRPSS